MFKEHNDLPPYRISYFPRNSEHNLQLVIGVRKPIKKLAIEEMSELGPISYRQSRRIEKCAEIEREAGRENDDFLQRISIKQQQRRGSSCKWEFARSSTSRFYHRRGNGR
ncbi:hypothetical protein AVEN_205083-1 [Araneus ventricosus]|uniref:Uncharacterized protein n=1 Tax=Araneus ventricosus TaxID=182803 RepID=A0A4Y2H290_ARAVE|nr:hypothetical protein AVEN_205083-1 [Araneus ventricosus]